MPEQCWWEPYAIRIAELLAGQTLIGADRLLDEARRICWEAAFEEIPGAEAAEAHDAAPLARAVARGLDGLSFDQVNHVLVAVRLATWRARYSERHGASGGEPESAEPPSLH